MLELASLLLSDLYGTQHEGLEEYADRKNRIQEIEDSGETPTDEERELKVIKFPDQIAQDANLKENMKRFTNEYNVSRKKLEDYLFGIMISDEEYYYDRINVLERALKLAVNRRRKKSHSSKDVVGINSPDIKGDFRIEPQTMRNKRYNEESEESDESSLGTHPGTPTPQLVRDITSASSPRSA